ncbi:group II intron maturase-specific domain-containing protein [Micromonospora sp. CPCC 206061]|uniref:group II intron maturase-specific domain-containing protein n=1 Tax=Micromonospora sp. CPCC 206061 TaxID=3122410 RepID=UPI002FEFE19D
MGQHLQDLPQQQVHERHAHDPDRRVHAKVDIAQNRTSNREPSIRARQVNPVVRGWMNFYGAFYRSALSILLARINTYLVRWTRKKYKRLRARRKARTAWDQAVQRHPRFFAHWAWVTNPLMIKMAGAE